MFYHINRWVFLLITTTFISYFFKIQNKITNSILHMIVSDMLRIHMYWFNLKFHFLKEHVWTVFYFASLIFLVPLKSLSYIWRRHNCRCRIAHFDVCSAIISVKQWCFCCVSYLLWHCISIYNDHLRKTVTLTPFVVRLAVELSITQPFAC